MHGLGDGAYWMVTYTWFWVLYVVYMAIFIGFGSLIGLNMFTKNNLGIQVRRAHSLWPPRPPSPVPAAPATPAGAV